MSNFLEIEGKKYPTVILGGDRFLGLFGEPRHKELKEEIVKPDYIYKIMHSSYKSDCRGFDLSINDNVINSFKKLKEKYPDCVGIANPNWDCGLNLEGGDLGKFEGRIIATLFDRFLSVEEMNKISKLDKHYKERWFSFDKEDKPLTQKEIDAININLDKYQKKLEKVRGVADFCLIGTGYADWLPLLGRMDIFQDLIKLVRKNGFIPLSVHHWTSLVLPKLDKLDFAGHWTYLNKNAKLIDEEDVLETINKCSKPITAFKAIISREKKEIKEYLKYLSDISNVKAVDFGIETVDEAKSVLEITSEYF